MTSTITPTTTAEEVAARSGAMHTVRRGLSLSPELRRGLLGTVALALLATAGSGHLSGRRSLSLTPAKAGLAPVCLPGGHLLAPCQNSYVR